MAVLTIGGSDPDGGAGIQADLKTFYALGLDGISVITAITAQNTRRLYSILYTPSNILKDQLQALFSDFNIEAVKIGMLGKKETIQMLGRELKKYKAKNIVLDTVMTTQADKKQLLPPNSTVHIVKYLFPISSIITPNCEEASIITGIKITDLKSAEFAAKRLLSLKVKNIVIKGIKENGKIHDLFYSKNKKKVFSKPAITGGTHGGGCVFSSAIAANLAIGKNVLESIEMAEHVIENAILYRKRPGKGIEIVDPLAAFNKDAERYHVLSSLKKALDAIESKQEFSEIIPEVGSNLGYALKNAKDLNDVAVVVGRIRNAFNKPKSLGIVDFGASSHVARMLLKMLEFDKEKRSAINIRYSEKKLQKLKKLGLSISYYARDLEPGYIRQAEGLTMAWGIEQAVRNSKKIPDVIYHKGAMGKEPQIIIFAKNPNEVVQILHKLK